MASPEVKTGVILLAAGQGRRFGGGKLTAHFRGRPLWEWAALTAEKVGATNRLIVVAPESPISGRTGWKRVVNPNAGDGMGSSIAAGIRAATDCERVMILLADMPRVTPAHLKSLLELDGVVFSRHENGTNGCPAVFPKSVFERLGKLAADHGARNLALEDAQFVTPGDMRELADIDTVGDLETLCQQN